MKDNKRPPRDGLVRARPGLELRASDGENGGMPTLCGHFAVFNEWTEINSIFEGHFMERIAPGAFKKTFREHRDDIKVLFQHGQDPQIGDKPLGRLTELREDDKGAYYEAPLFDTAYNRDLLPGLEAGVYGASFKFRVVKEEFNKDPEPSDHNPHGIPERTIQEAQVYEGGPVTFPAYAGATAGVRSLTDEMLVERMVRDPDRLAQLLEFAQGRAAADADDEGRDDAGDATDTTETTETTETDRDDVRAAEEHSDADATEPAPDEPADDDDVVVEPDGEGRSDDALPEDEAEEQPHFEDDGSRSEATSTEKAVTTDDLLRALDDERQEEDRLSLADDGDDDRYWWRSFTDQKEWDLP